MGSVKFSHADVVCLSPVCILWHSPRLRSASLVVC